MYASHYVLPSDILTIDLLWRLFIEIFADREEGLRAAYYRAVDPDVFSRIRIRTKNISLIKISILNYLGSGFRTSSDSDPCFK